MPVPGMCDILWAVVEKPPVLIISRPLIFEERVPSERTRVRENRPLCLDPLHVRLPAEPLCQFVTHSLLKAIIPAPD